MRRSPAISHRLIFGIRSGTFPAILKDVDSPGDKTFAIAHDFLTCYNQRMEGGLWI